MYQSSSSPSRLDILYDIDGQIFKGKQWSEAKQN